MESVVATSLKLGQQERAALAQTVLNLFDRWKLNVPEQLTMLGIAESNRNTLSRYRAGEALGASRDQLDRIGNLLAIHKNLRLLFPRNDDLAYAWMQTRNLAFAQKTPVEVVREFGFLGLLMVRGYLDRQRGI